jgi:CRP-like cAMP-binding protein
MASFSRGSASSLWPPSDFAAGKGERGRDSAAVQFAQDESPPSTPASRPPATPASRRAVLRASTMSQSNFLDNLLQSEESAHRLRKKGAHGKWRAIFYPTLPWGLPAHENVNSTGALFLQVWELVVAASCLYMAFVIPYSLGFERVYLADREHCLFLRDTHAPLFLTTRWIDIFVDILFMFDIALNFFTARWVLKGGTLEHWELVDELPQIAQLYLFDTLVPDAIGSLPVQYLDCIPGVSAGNMKLMRLMRVFKLLRLTRLKNFVKALEAFSPNSRYLVVALKLLIAFGLCAHMTGCFFFFIAYGWGDPDGHDLDESDPRKSHFQEMFMRGWVFKDGLVNEDGTLAEHAPSPWVTSFYWAVTTMSTIGYGDISPGTESERLLGCFLMVVGCAFFAWITSSITEIMTSKPACETRFDEVIGDVETFMRAHLVPPQLRTKIIDYYKVRYPSRRIWDEEAIIADIESPFLRKDIVEHLFKDVVTQVPLLRLLDSESVREISYKLRCIYRMPGRVITHAGTPPDFLYIVRFGHVSVKGWSMSPQLCAPGDIFGEMAMLGLSPDGLRMRTATATSVVELCQLATADLHELLAQRVNFFKIVKTVCQTHMVGLREARKRMSKVSASHAYNWQQMKGVDKQPPKDFYEELSSINWRGICEVLKDKQTQAQVRHQMSRFDDAKIAELEKTDGRKMLRTFVHLTFKTLAPGNNVASSNRSSSVANLKRSCWLEWYRSAGRLHAGCDFLEYL